MPKLPAQTYQDIDISQKAEILRQKLKLKTLQAKSEFKKKHAHAEAFLTEKGVDLAKIREHSAKMISAGALTGALLLNQPSGAPPPPPPAPEVRQVAIKSSQEELLEKLGSILPSKVRPLTHEEEKRIEQVFGSIVGVPAKATLEGEHLNTTYGLIGAEQHLKRYPGDTLEQHGSGIILKEGIAPGLGAWRYFAPSKAQLTSDLVETEKWYAVVQTLYLPDWNTRTKYLVQWYKYRKVLIVNTQNGKAVVAAIADAGPAAWTGKHFGGSPEVMQYLGGARYKKGPVILFFVDDPDNKVPLGPVEYSNINKLPLAQVSI